MYYFDDDVYDLKYVGLNLQYILAILAELNDPKHVGKYYDVSHMRKLLCSQMGIVLTNKRLLTNFYSKLDTFLLLTNKNMPTKRKRQC